MTITPDLDAPRVATSDGFTDAVTVAFGDPASGLCGTFRLGLAGGGTASGLAVVFHDREPAAVVAEGGSAVADPSRWDGVHAAGIDMETVEPLRNWRVSYAGDDVSLDLELEASGSVAQLASDDPVATLGGMLGFEQPVTVRGHAEVRGSHIAVEGLGQRGRSWGSPDWTAIDRTRTVQAWFAGGAVSIYAIAATGRAHGEEAVSAAIMSPHGCVFSQEPRLSTTFDADGRQQRAAMELPLDDDSPPRRISGEVFCGTTLDLGRLRLDCSFLRWRMNGDEGIGRYDVLRRVEDA